VAANPYSTLTAKLVTALQTLSTPYTGLVVRRQVYTPNDLPPDFSTWMILVTPSQSPWAERRLATASIQYVMSVDLYLFRANSDEGTLGDTLWGTDADPARGLFQFIEDVKVLLRDSDLDGFLVKTHDEPGGDPAKLGAGAVTFGAAVPGYDGNAKFPFAHRARIPYRAQLQPFCHPRTFD
jgi:hypothetical protein